MASNQTTNYSLNQWAAEDRVLRSEFNADNEKLDAALAGLATEVATRASQDEVTGLKNLVTAKANQSDLTALQTAVSAKAEQSSLTTLQSQVAAGDLWVKVAQVTTAAAGTTVSVDLSGIDLFDYWQLRVLFYCGPCGPISVLVNNDATAHAYMASNVYSNDYYSTSYIAYYSNVQSNYAIAGIMDSQLIIPGYPPAFYYTQAGLYGQQISDIYGNHRTMTWEELTSIDFTCTTEIPAGAQILVLGLKK